MRIRRICLFAVLIVISFAGCTGETVETGKTNDTFTIVASLFPQYDFARQIVGDKAEVVLLLPPGAESHTFDPKPGDIRTIYGADLFLYTGELMEPWAHAIIEGVAGQPVQVIDVIEGISLKESDHSHGDEDHDHDDSEGHGHDLDFDPHVWLDPTLAEAMVDNILAAVVAVDPANQPYYEENARRYKEELFDLDNRIWEAVNRENTRTLVFGGRFAYLYFLDRYQIDYVTAYESCQVTAEPSVQKMAEVIRFGKDHNIQVVYHEELSTYRVAQSIANEIGAKCLLFSTGHNVTKEEMDRGITYLELMEKNLENIKEGLYGE